MLASLSQMTRACLLAIGLVVLCAPATAAAIGEEPHPHSSMESPLDVEVDSRLWQDFEEDKEEKEQGSDGTEEGEPATPFSGSICRAAGYVDPEAAGYEEIGPDFALRWTYWYAFRGTGGPMVVRLDADSIFGVALYRTDGVPVATDGSNCTRWSQAGQARFVFDSDKGARYLLQVGDTRYFGEPAFGLGFFLSVARPTPNPDRAHAAALPLDGSVLVSNIDGGLEPPAPICSGAGKEYVGGRSAWGKINLSSAGALRVRLEQGAREAGSVDMIALYRDGESSPFACSVGPFKPSVSTTTEFEAEVPAGEYSLRFMTAVKSGEDPVRSLEERWRVTTSFNANLDLDGDGYTRPGDCKDGDAGVHPGALDVPDNGIDENCEGQDVRRDSDGDGVPDYRDRCATRPSRGIDADGNGCRDPEQLKLTAQIRLTLSNGRLHVASLFVRTDTGARIELECNKGACGSESRKVGGKRAQFSHSFIGVIPDGTEVSLTATKPRHIGVVKQYRLSVKGVRLLRQWCTKPGRPIGKIACA